MSERGKLLVLEVRGIAGLPAHEAASSIYKHMHNAERLYEIVSHHLNYPGR